MALPGAVCEVRGVLTPRDRRDAGWLVLLVMSFGLVIAPVLHSVSHAHGHQHGPVEQPDAPHGADSLEHQQLALLTGPEHLAVRRFAVALIEVPAFEQQAPVGERRFAPEQSQAP